MLCDYPLTYEILNQSDELIINPYASKNKIVLGSKKPYFEYDGVVPEDELVCIPIDPADLEFEEREALNILVLGGSGDGKSMLAKLIWWQLHYSGYQNLYIDPKDTKSGRARRAWDNVRVPPKVTPKGIPIKHYVPITVMARGDFEHMAHNFKKYALRLKNMDERDMWMGLGLTNVAAIRVKNIIDQFNRHNKKLSLSSILFILAEMKVEGDLNTQTFNSIKSRFEDLKYLGVFDTSVPELPLIKDLNAGYSVVISYNSRDKLFMSFDVGEKIRRLMKSYHSGERKKPVMVFFDDSSYYAKFMKGQQYNLSVDEIQGICDNYRSLGIYNCHLVQRLGIIDDNLGEAYPIKIISPMFAYPESLNKIKIPKDTIHRIRNAETQMYIDKIRHVMEWTLVMDGKATSFFPFNPPCQHFQRVYYPKKK